MSERESPGDLEIAGCTLRVVIARNAIIAILEGQDIGSTFGSDQAREEINLTDVPFLVVHDGGALPPPLCFVVAPHLQVGFTYLHTHEGRVEHEFTPI